MDQIEEFNFDTLTIDQLQTLLATLEKSNSQTSIENRILERHGDRVLTIDPKDKDKEPTSNPQIDPTSSQQQVLQGQAGLAGGVGQKRKKKVEKKMNDDPIALSLDQKHDILQKECEELLESLQKQKDDSAVLLDNFKAESECYEVSLGELKKEMSEFRRDVMCAQTTQRPQSSSPIPDHPHPPNAEKLLRFFEEKTRARDSYLEKTRLKNTSLRSHRQKLRLQLKQKEEMGEVLHAIDFDQLQIENSQFLGKIEERNGDLGKLKMKTGMIQSRLNGLKQVLEGVTNETKEAVAEITQRRGLIAKLVNESSRVDEQTLKAEMLSLQLCEQISDYKVIDYVKLQAEQTELEEKVKVLNRKIGIQTLHLKKSVESCYVVDS